jgi:hypothetical protein
MIARTSRRTKTFQRIRWKVFVKREVFAITGKSHVRHTLHIRVYAALRRPGQPDRAGLKHGRRSTTLGEPGIRDGRTGNEVRLPARRRSSCLRLK